MPSPITATFARTSAGESSRDASISTVAAAGEGDPRELTVARGRAGRAVRAADRTGRSSMAGATITRAPRWSSSLTNDADWSAGRVTRIVRPASGFARARAHPTSTCARIRSAPWAISDFAASAAASSGVRALGARPAAPVTVGGGDDRRPAGSGPSPRWRTHRAAARSRRPAATSTTARRRARTVAHRVVEGPKHADRRLRRRPGVCTARHPWPGAGTIASSGERPGVSEGSVPSRARPGRRQHQRRPPRPRRASAAACRRCRGVGDIEPGNAASSCARRRSADVPITAPARARRGRGRSGRRRDRRAAARRRS